MEPMNLGSPPSSPASPNPNTFLPSFLLGDSQPTSPSPITSPGRNKTPNLKFQQGYGGHNNPTNLRQKLFNQSINEYTMQNTYNSPPMEKSGPPKQSLFDTIDSKPQTPILNSTMQNVAEMPTFSPNESYSRIGNESMNYSCNMNESRTAFQNTVAVRNDRIDTLWVTVFGFAPSATSLVLTQMANCGNIVDKKYPTQGNWLHLKYSSHHEVAKAMLMNGKFITNFTMVGVTLYYNKQDNTHNKENDNSFTSPIRVRSLRNTSISHQPSNTVIAPQNLPQKSTGLVTKAMEYVFGW